jgi:NTP pyrophosphatase (non-canonical NTP hydrolase)
MLGLMGEVGEVAERLKKAIRSGHDINSPEVREKLMDEMGDVLWYVAAVAQELHMNLGQIALRNLEKLQGRQKSGTLHCRRSDSNA